eukprot:4884272-Pyramimonas_sp.AAC.1
MAMTHTRRRLGDLYWKRPQSLTADCVNRTRCKKGSQITLYSHLSVKKCQKVSKSVKSDFLAKKLLCRLVCRYIILLLHPVTLGRLRRFREEAGAGDYGVIRP